MLIDLLIMLYGILEMCHRPTLLLASGHAIPRSIQQGNLINEKTF